jgi:hypothetical protein
MTKMSENDSLVGNVFVLSRRVAFVPMLINQCHVTLIRLVKLTFPLILSSDIDRSAMFIVVPVSIVCCQLGMFVQLDMSVSNRIHG